MASSSVQVAVRLRPINDKEKKHGTLPVVTASTAEKTVTVIKGKGTRQVRSQFSFDNVFTSFSTQEEVFDETLKPVISDVFKGYESTVFAYGQTGTGKTHTMEGDLSNPDNHGVIPRSARAIFDNLRSPQYSNHVVTCSYLEIYNEDLGDLLSDGSNKVAMMEGKNGVVCRGLSEERVDSAADVLRLMSRAQHRRHIGETKMNKHSSRSHCIFTIKVTASVQVADGTVTLEGKLHMVDLAGSECAKTAGGDKTTGNEAARERERMAINRSLLTLGRVISILKEQSQSRKSSKNIRIPYRDSKLTRILQESLGGRCKTVIIATLSPSITAIEESMSTLNYAQSANGIVNKPVSTSFMAAGGGSGSLSGNSTPSKNGGITTESWHEMECRLQYMQTQVEEAQAALGRKHMQQAELVERAEKAEQDVTDREVRIGLMEKEMNTIKSNLSDEINRRRSAEAKMREAEYALKKTTAILVATQKTECNLTSEATALLQTLKDAVADGDILYKTIVECKQVEVKRQAATKSFRQAALEVLEDSVESLGGLASDVDAHAETLMTSAARGYDEENSSLVATQAVVKGITDTVKSVTDTVRRQLVDDDGIIPLLKDLASSIDAKSSAAINTISQGEASLEASCVLAGEKFVEHAQRLKELETAYSNASSESITALETNVADNKSRIEGMVESASRALQDAKNVRAERMKSMSQLISAWKEASLDASNGMNNAATSQSSAIDELVVFMETEMARHDTTRTILSEQKAFIDANEAALVDDLSSQSSLLSTQHNLIAKAQEEQKEMKTDIMKTIMSGVEELVNQQMQRLASSNEKHFNGMISSNRTAVESNAAMVRSTGNMSEKLRNANSALSRESQKIRENDMHTRKVVEGTGKVLGDISEMATKNATAATSHSDTARNNVVEMQRLAKESEKILKGIKSDGQKCAKHIEKTIHNQTKQDLLRLASTSNQICAFASDTIISDASAAIDTVQESRKEPTQIFHNHMADMVESAKIGEKKIEVVSQVQAEAAKNLCASVAATHQDFNSQIAEQQQARMESRKGELVQIAKSHYTSSKEKIASAEALSRDVVQRIGTYSAFADEDVNPAPTKKIHEYSATLSATPAQDVIIRDANIQEEHHTDSDEESTKSVEKPINEDEECSSQLSQDISHTSQDAINTSTESDRSSSLTPPIKLKEVAVNKSSSTIGQKQSAIPRPTLKRTGSSSRSSRSASSPAISRKRAKTSRHGSSTPRGTIR